MSKMTFKQIVEETEKTFGRPTEKNEEVQLEETQDVTKMTEEQINEYLELVNEWEWLDRWSGRIAPWQYGKSKGEYETQQDYEMRMLTIGEFEKAFANKHTYSEGMSFGILNFKSGYGNFFNKIRADYAQNSSAYAPIDPSNLENELQKPLAAHTTIVRCSNGIDYRKEPHDQSVFMARCVYYFHPETHTQGRLAMNGSRVIAASNGTNIDGIKLFAYHDYVVPNNPNCYLYRGFNENQTAKPYSDVVAKDQQNYYISVQQIITKEFINALIEAIDQTLPKTNDSDDGDTAPTDQATSGGGTTPPTGTPATPPGGIPPTPGGTAPAASPTGTPPAGTSPAPGGTPSATPPPPEPAQGTIRRANSMPTGEVSDLTKQCFENYKTIAEGKNINATYNDFAYGLIGKATKNENVLRVWFDLLKSDQTRGNEFNPETYYYLAFGVPQYPFQTDQNEMVARSYFDGLKNLAKTMGALSNADNDFVFATDDIFKKVERSIASILLHKFGAEAKQFLANAVFHPVKTFNSVYSRIKSFLAKYGPREGTLPG